MAFFCTFLQKLDALTVQLKKYRHNKSKDFSIIYSTDLNKWI